MLPTLYNLIAHAGDRQINPLFLFVHGYIIGKTRRWKITRYHAKGRGAQGKKDQIQVRIILKVKN